MGSNMTIRCNTMQEFMDVVYECVTRGLTFESDTGTLVIRLTGGY